VNRPVAQQASSTPAGTIPGIKPWQPGAASHEPFPWIILTVLTTVGAVLRIVGLDEGLWLDEIKMLIDSVRPSLLQILTSYPTNNQHPLYAVLAHVSVTFFGEHPWSLRLPAMLFGVASIPLIYLVGIQFTTRTEALLTSGLLTVSYHHIWFSQNARGYTALAFWALLATFLLMRMLATGKSRYLVCYVAASALGVYTHLTMVFVVAGHAVLIGGLMLFPATRKEIHWQRPVMGFVLAGVLSFLFYFPVLPDVHNAFLVKHSTIQMATPPWALLEMLRGLKVGLGTGAAVLTAGLLLLLGGWSYFRQSPFAAGLFFVPGMLMMAAAVVLHRPTFPRFFFFMIGFGLLTMTRGGMRFGEILSRLPGYARRFPAAGNRLGVIVVSAMMVAFTLTLNELYRYPKQDFVRAMQYVNSHAQPSDIVATVGLTGFPYREYYHQPWERADTIDELGALLLRGQRVWVIYTLLDRVKGGTPDVMRALENDFSTERVFPGTLSEGEVIVGMAEPNNASPK